MLNEKSKAIEKIEKVALRELWKKEGNDFSKWLEENIDFLNDVLDFEITIEKREEYAGPYRVDLLGTDEYGRKVIIENQLERTDHDHLGKLITYLTNLDAKTAIWITSDAVQEHVNAINWLNENSPDDVSFYLIRIEAIKIGSQSPAAPLFTIVARPSIESKKIGEEKKEFAERHILRKHFWGQLLEIAKTRTRLHANITPSIYSWIGTGGGKSGISLNYVITNKYGCCEIYLDRGKESVEPNINKIRFDRLLKHKKEIEDKFGDKLSWERLDNKRASRIAVYFEFGGLHDQDKWEKLQDKMIDAMIRLEKATKEYIQSLD
jgi:hypothetical protein